MSDINIPADRPKKIIEHSDYVQKAEQDLLDQQEKSDEEHAVKNNPLLPIEEKDWNDMTKENLEEEQRKILYEKGVKSIQGKIEKE